MSRIQIPTLAVLVLMTINCATMVMAADKYRQNIFFPSTLTSAVWKGDNQGYAQARQVIDQETSGGQGAAALVNRYQAQANQSPTNPLAVFRWAYASRKAALTSNPFSITIADQALDALNRDGKPHPYDYVRLQFLLASDVWPVSSLEPLGKRLLQYKADDQPVQFQLVVDMGSSTALGDRKEALAIALDLVRRDPKNPRDHALLAGAYSSQWMLTKERSVADRAIAEYQLYLKLAPANGNFRRGAEQMVRAMRKSEL